MIYYNITNICAVYSKSIPVYFLPFLFGNYCDVAPVQACIFHGFAGIASMHDICCNKRYLVIAVELVERSSMVDTRIEMRLVIAVELVERSSIVASISAQLSLVDNRFEGFLVFVGL